MIHSLSGGVLKTNKLYDFVKVEILEGQMSGNIFWYITNITLNSNDIVLVPVGNSIQKAKVLRVDTNVNEQSAPISVKRAKEIYKLVTE